MFRKILFWLHLSSGVVAGLVIGVMSITGVAITFQPQVLDWLRRDLQELTPPAGSERLPLETIIERVQEQYPGKTPTAITVPVEPNLPVIVRYGRVERVYANPWTGAVIPDPAAGWARFFWTMTVWHRWLGAEGDNRALGKAITGVSNAAFLVLALTGIYLWMPRRWGWKAVRAVLWFRGGLKGKARDFNWHHVIGLWTLPVIVVLTATAVVISYDWMSDLTYRVFGEEPLVRRGGPPKVEVPAPPLGAEPLPLDELVAVARNDALTLESVTVPLGKRDQATHLTLREPNPWPTFSSTTLTLDPFTGAVLSREGYEDFTPGRKLRSWIRFLHTGEALKWPGQLAAGIASLGGVVLVWTGFALSLRRLAAWRRRRAARPSRLPHPTEDATGSEPAASTSQAS